MKEIPLGAFVDVMPAPQGPLTRGWFLGWQGYNGSGLVFFEHPDHKGEHNIGCYRADQIVLSGSVRWLPATEKKRFNRLFTKPEEVELQAVDWPVEVIMAAPEDWTTNYLAGDKVYHAKNGELTRVKVVTEFRNTVAYRYPVGTVSSAPVDDIIPELPNSKEQKMRLIENIVTRWKLENCHADQAVKDIKEALK